MAQKKSRRLGRGLTTLMADEPVDLTPQRKAEEPTDESTPASTPTVFEPPVDLGPRVTDIAITDLFPNTYQPRRTFDESELSELAESIRTQGVLQPVLVRPREGGGYEIVAGERRVRASERVERRTVPAIIRKMDDRTAAEWALVENVQRADLNPVDRARGMARLRDAFGLSHAEIAERLGLERPSVSNALRLLELSDVILDHLASGALTAGHAKALLGRPAEDRDAVAERAIKEGWSVRKLESHPVRIEDASDASAGDVTRVGAAQAANVRRLETAIGDHLGTRVRIRSTAKGTKGTVSIEYYNLDHFDDLLDRLGVSRTGD